ncbi:hypothetical protein VCHA48P437_40048 [Vibrio chagasii]|nr:hypothetical protein VCHA48P437_40048 [Vibrio chagasii]CAH7314670.1 hypothetical protein VCHA44O286_40047 [Vibrio chagasii]CAH7323320.1 hypothetical protein VCHA53O466_30353 [Vibrio chagasii]
MKTDVGYEPKTAHYKLLILKNKKSSDYLINALIAAIRVRRSF